MVFLSLLLQTNGARFITTSYTTIAMPVLRVKFDKDSHRAVAKLYMPPAAAGEREG
jgi:hypothetical protein